MSLPKFYQLLRAGSCPTCPAISSCSWEWDGMEILPTLGTGPCPQLLGVGKQGVALSSTLGRGPRVPAWAGGQLSPEIVEPEPPHNTHLVSPREGYMKGSFRAEVGKNAPHPHYKPPCAPGLITVPSGLRGPS